MTQLLRSVVSRGFLYIFVLLAIGALITFDFDNGQLMLWFLLPFYVTGLLLQWIMPRKKVELERGELVTDIVSNAFAFLLGHLQGLMATILFGLLSASLLIHFGLLDPGFGLSNLPIWAQIMIGLLVFDFMFYCTHRAAHEIPFLWRFHSVHHCAHRVTLMNAYRVHPLDMVLRRFVPVFVLIQTGISQEAFVGVAVIGSVFGTITHLNVDLRHGFLNYIIGTNEMHRWHHSTVYSEAKNFGGFMVWDHMFGTFYKPKDREEPETIGLGNEDNYPIHNYWQMLMIPFRWNSLKQKPGEAPKVEPIEHDAPAVAQVK